MRQGKGWHKTLLLNKLPQVRGEICYKHNIKQNLNIKRDSENSNTNKEFKKINKTKEKPEMN